MIPLSAASYNAASINSGKEHQSYSTFRDFRDKCLTHLTVVNNEEILPKQLVNYTNKYVTKKNQNKSWISNGSQPVKMKPVSIPNSDDHTVALPETNLNMDMGKLLVPSLRPGQSMGYMAGWELSANSRLSRGSNKSAITKVGPAH